MSDGPKWAVSRRSVLRGLGVSMALPFLDAMMPKGALAAAAEVAAPSAEGAAAAAGAASGTPVRMAFFSLPNGMNMKQFTPAVDGSAFELSPTLEPLRELKDAITVVSGLSNENARSKGDGPGDHARGAAAFLTGAHPYKTSGSNIKLGISVDQMVAQKIGHLTRLPSLELGVDKGGSAGECDSGYSCAYTNNISWRSETSPMPKEVNPAALFDRLFGSADERANAENRAKREAYRRSILDFVREDAKSLDRRLGQSDRHKLDEFTTSIREVEKRVEATRIQGGFPTPPADVSRPTGAPTEFPEHMKLMCDLLVLAFQMDLTRVSTFMMGHEGSNRTFPWIGVTEGHHAVSHHGNNAAKLEQVAKIDRFHMEQFAYFLNKLKTTPDGNGTLLDHSAIMLGSGISDGNRHNHFDLPIVLAGRAGGSITPGRHVQVPKNTPLCNLYLSLLERMSIEAQHFGDSTGALKELTA